jgi:pyridoxal 5'-phosphate synthase pdxT subunit
VQLQAICDLPTEAGKMTPKIGVLALQGSFALHKAHLNKAGSGYQEVKYGYELGDIDGLILPGGESTTMLKHIKELNMWSELKKFIETRPTWAICAGVILIAKNVTNPNQESFNVLDIEVSRNSYGRQLDSFEENINGTVVSFIRAPVIRNVASEITVHHTTNGNPTWLEQGKIMITTFHPELARVAPSSFHQRFVKKVADSISNKQMTTCT